MTYLSDVHTYEWVMIITTVIIIIAILAYPKFFTLHIIIFLFIVRIAAGSLILEKSDYVLEHGVYGGGAGRSRSRRVSSNKEKNSEYLKMSLMDPKHNLREIAKQLILLEDHMAHKPKRCIDCITKHYLMTEGLLEETITLDKAGTHVEEVREITERVKPAVMKIIDLIKSNKINDAAYQDACQTLREVRKAIALKYVLDT